MHKSRLTLLVKNHKKKGIHYYGLYQCSCGTIKAIRHDHIKRGKIFSCGCLKREISKKYNTKHGLAGHIIYNTFYCMLSRCYNKKTKHYKNYGGRGIIICDEWRNDKELFFKWALDNGWSKELEIDRIDNDGNYEPSNCRFVAHNINAQNTRTTKLNVNLVSEIINLLKQSIPQRTIAKKYGVAQKTIFDIKRNKIWQNVPRKEGV